MACQIRCVGICRRQDEVFGQGAAARGTPCRAHYARPARREALLAQAPLARGLASVDEDHHALSLWEAILLEDLHRWAHKSDTKSVGRGSLAWHAYEGPWLIHLCRPCMPGGIFPVKEGQHLGQESRTAELKRP